MRLVLVAGRQPTSRLGRASSIRTPYSASIRCSVDSTYRGSRSAFGMGICCSPQLRALMRTVGIPGEHRHRSTDVPLPEVESGRDDPIIWVGGIEPPRDWRLTVQQE
jgi:hypothetical protein